MGITLTIIGLLIMVFNGLYLFGFNIWKVIPFYKPSNKGYYARGVRKDIEWLGLQVMVGLDLSLLGVVVVL